MYPQRMAFVMATILLVTENGTAIAQTATDNLNVTITITSECVVDAPDPLNFQSQSSLAVQVSSQVDFTVSCNDGLPYNIRMGGGGSGDTTARVMTSEGNDSGVAYQLFSDNNNTIVWDETTGVDSEGTGAPVTHTIFGQVPAQNTPPAGTYNDTVTITVEF